MAIALVLGGTGLVGRALTQLLLADDHWHAVHLFLRRSTGIQHSRLQEHLIDFDAPESWAPLIKGDALFSALGTTLATAGSKEAQYIVDYTYQYNFAEAAAANGVAHYALVSAAGASPKALVFYSRMKGELEEAVSKLPFPHIAIMQPGLLDGQRTAVRTGEKWALRLSKALYGITGWTTIKPIEDVEVAKAMIVTAKTQKVALKKYSHREMFPLAPDYDVMKGKGI